MKDNLLIYVCDVQGQPARMDPDCAVGPGGVAGTPASRLILPGGPYRDRFVNFMLIRSTWWWIISTRVWRGRGPGRGVD